MRYMELKRVRVWKRSEDWIVPVEGFVVSSRGWLCWEEEVRTGFGDFPCVEEFFDLGVCTRIIVS